MTKYVISNYRFIIKNKLFPLEAALGFYMKNQFIMFLFAIYITCSLKFKSHLRRNKSNEKQCHRYALQQAAEAEVSRGTEAISFSYLPASGEEKHRINPKAFQFFTLGTRSNSQSLFAIPAGGRLGEGSAWPSWRLEAKSPFG